MLIADKQQIAFVVSNIHEKYEILQKESMWFEQRSLVQCSKTGK